MEITTELKARAAPVWVRIPTVIPAPARTDAMRALLTRLWTMTLLILEKVGQVRRSRRLSSRVTHTVWKAALAGEKPEARRPRMVKKGRRK